MLLWQMFAIQSSFVIVSRTGFLASLTASPFGSLGSKLAPFSRVGFYVFLMQILQNITVGE
ncbi:WSSV253 [White spot syndrome virus]|uniref:WSSV253 n=1 Tax=White spot syndrome virus TaxID=342409 RepID=A0A2I6SBX8_9VIRU|nr:WSSV253 [White spot syndrome virus]